METAAEHQLKKEKRSSSGSKETPIKLNLVLIYGFAGESRIFCFKMYFGVFELFPHKVSWKRVHVARFCSHKSLILSSFYRVFTANWCNNSS